MLPQNYRVPLIRQSEIAIRDRLMQLFLLAPLHLNMRIFRWVRCWCACVTLNVHNPVSEQAASAVANLADRAANQVTVNKYWYPLHVLLMN